MKIDYYNKKALIELLKSAARFLWFGLLGLVVTVLGLIVTSGALNDITLTVVGMKINLGLLAIAGIGFVAKAIDLYVRKNKSIKANGIAPPFLQR